MRAHLQETIGQARIAHAESLEAYVGRVTGLQGQALRAEVEGVMAIVEGIPGLLESVSEAAMARGIGLMVQPLLDHAADYFRDPADHAPEAAYGVAGLLDDAYLALNIVHLVHENFEGLQGSGVTAGIQKLRELLEPDLVAELDAEVGRAVLKLARAVTALSERSGLDVEFVIQRH